MRQRLLLPLLALAALRCASYEGAPDAVAPIEAGTSTPPGPGDAAVKDAAPAGPRRCAADSPFVESRPVRGLESPQFRGTLRLSSDELTAVFSQYDVNRTAWDLYLATRASTAAPFGEPTPITDANSGDYQRYPTITTDGLTLFFDRFEKEAPPNEFDPAVFRLNRPTPSGNFMEANFIAGMPKGGYEPYFGASPGSMYYTYVDTSTEEYSIWRAQVDASAITATAKFFGSPFGVSTPVVSADETEMYAYIYEEGADGGDDLGYPKRLIRSSTAEDFVESADPIALADGEFTWLSPDACRLYYTLQFYDADADSQPPSGQLYVLTRSP